MRKIILLALVAGFTMVSCDKKENIVVEETITPEENGMQIDTPTGDNSKTSVDWAGTYEGTLPCADCEGIKTIIVLNSDETYTLTSEYLGKDNTVESSGAFTWDTDGNNISITSEDGTSTTYKVGENKLIQLDQEGNEITGSMAELYVLNKK